MKEIENIVREFGNDMPFILIKLVTYCKLLELYVYDEEGDYDVLMTELVELQSLLTTSGFGKLLNYVEVNNAIY